MSADLRQACDRCHSKKLRCPRPAGSAECARCSRARVPCLFSPPSRASRPFRRHDAAAAVAVAVAAAGDALTPVSVLPTTALPSSLPLGDPLLAWDPVACPPYGDFAVFTPSASPDALNLSDGPASAFFARTADPGPGDESAIAKLTGIMLALDRVLRSLPTLHQLGIPDDMPVDQVIRYIEELNAKVDIRNNVEAILLHTQHLIIVYPDVLRLALPAAQRPDTDTDTDNQVHVVDDALLHLLIACHKRVLDCLCRLLDSCRTCTKTVAPLIPHGYDPTFNTPEVRIGSFVAPKAAAATILLSMISEMYLKLIAGADSFVAQLTSIQGDVDHLGPLIAQSRALCDRTRVLTKETTEAREKLALVGIEIN
ncbi:hypothetical protein B0I35DRAFT_406193 [Stachybotrys elegans]|uniref:Zn(2)-C6 fungal-type domain-containing protein n=1 Tax=Stachybotrys elegans TaxID=80388 RepID=A0A8K0WTL5_9HYPO|nr:hypothetical protein B0I35DRAFT_406193 [Stachybotrys elegans]